MKKIILRLLRFLPLILFTFAFYISRYARHPEKYPMEVRYARLRKLIVKVVDSFHIDHKVEGEENLTNLQNGNEKFLIVGNHLASIDPLLYIYHSEKPITFVAKKELEKVPLVGKAIKSISGMFLDRENLRSSIAIIKNVEHLIKDNITSVAIFPEGTRNKNPEGELPEFHGGTFKPAMRLNCPILPVSSYGSQYILDRKAKRIPYEIAFLPPIYAKDFSDENSISLASKAHDIIAEKMYEQREENNLFYNEGKDKIPMKKGDVR